MLSLKSENKKDIGMEHGGTEARGSLLRSGSAWYTQQVSDPELLSKQRKQWSWPGAMAQCM